MYGNDVQLQGVSVVLKHNCKDKIKIMDAVINYAPYCTLQMGEPPFEVDHAES